MSEIEKLRKEMASLQVIDHQRWDRIRSIEDQIKELVATEIKDKKLLSKTTWRIELRGEYVYLCSDEQALQELTSLISNDGYHYSFPISDGLCLSFDDGEVYICFESDERDIPPEGLAEFIEDWEISVDTSSLDREIAALKDSTAILESVKGVIDEGHMGHLNRE